MHQPTFFREERTDIIHKLMRAHPFATLVSIQNGDICADHLPLVIHEEHSTSGTIRGHIAKGNPLWRNGGTSSDIVAIFQGPQAYITPSWYPSKKEHGKVVPTWNYVAVHARGKLTLTDDNSWLLDHLSELTKRHEHNNPVPWNVSDAPDDFIQRQRLFLALANASNALIRQVGLKNGPCTIYGAQRQPAWLSLASRPMWSKKCSIIRPAPLQALLGFITVLAICLKCETPWRPGNDI